VYHGNMEKTVVRGIVQGNQSTSYRRTTYCYNDSGPAYGPTARRMTVAGGANYCYDSNGN